jgi:hypothetical protein
MHVPAVGHPCVLAGSHICRPLRGPTIQPTILDYHVHRKADMTVVEQPDFFICHASEDKDQVVRQLVTQLSNSGASVWYDEFALTLGDSLRKNIDKALATARYGLVILSPSFLKKEWPERELSGLVAREIAERRKIVLPVYHNVTGDDVRRFSPPLADKLYVSTSVGITMVVEEIFKAFGAENVSFKDWTKAGSLGEWLQKHSYTHTLKLQGSESEARQFIAALGAKYRVHDLKHECANEAYIIVFDTGGCIELAELSELGTQHGLKVIENQLAMNGVC